MELGTHLGESYFAFCQAIVESGTICQAYAVDTWQGDIHTGAYGDEVFREVDEYNRQLYSGFSHLMKMLFDEAAAQFEAESIDLLHIDGIHTYEAVRHDFDAWWPKMRPGGIVLLHDTAGRHDDFGVWKLLEEMRESTPTAEFFHSNGLGVVLKPGMAREDGIIPLLFGDDALMQQLRGYYEICADHLEYRFWLARQKRPANWDVTTQLFWRKEEEGFTESASIRVAHTVTPERSRIALTIPRLTPGVAELRIDLTDRPAFLELHGISASDARGEKVWSMEGAAQVDELISRGLHGIAAGDGGGVLVFDTPGGASFHVPMPGEALQRLESGGQIIVEMSGLDPLSFASKLAAAGKHGREDVQRLALQQEQELQRYDRALGEAQRLASERLGELQRYDRALGDTQALAATRGTELDAARENLKAAEERIAVLQTELETHRRQMETGQEALATRKRELADLRQRLATIESSRLWRAVRPLTGIGTGNSSKEQG